MNDLVKFGGGNLPADPSALASGLQNMTQNIHAGSGGVPFLRLMRDGIWAYGQENIEPELDSEWAVNPYSFQHGWCCWSDGEKLDEVMVPANQQPPAYSELKDYGAKWDNQVSVQLQCLTGKDKGTTVIYQGTSVGLRNTIKELTMAVISQANADPQHIVPVIMFDTDHYQHKKYGKIFTPVLEIVRWANIDSGESESPEDEDDSPDAPGTSKPPIEKEPEPEKPARSRRGRRNTAEKTEKTETEKVQDEMEGKDPEEDQPRRRRRRRG